MDLATSIGFVVGMGFVIMGITSTGQISTFLDPGSFMIVVGGTIGAVFISFPLSKVLNILKIVKNAFTTKNMMPDKLINQIIETANIARKEGLLALEESADKVENEFLKKGILLIVDGTDPELVRNILEAELNSLEGRHEEGQSLFEAMGAYAPAFGMVGTLIGLINMLKDISDPSTIGPNMSTALITTFYGSFLANLVFIPIANKLKVRSKEEIFIKELIIEGLLSIQAGENPRIIEEKLKTFLPVDMRDKVGKELGSEGA